MPLLFAVAVLLLTMLSPLWIADRPEINSVDSYQRAVEMYRRGEIAEAAQLLQTLADTGNAKVGEWSLLGWCRLRLNEVDAAEVAFEAALSGDGAAVEPQVGLGFVDLRRGHSASARDRLSGVTRSTPSYAEAWKGLGLAYQQLNELKAARGAFQKAVELAPTDREARGFLEQNLSQVVEERRPRAAIERSTAPRFDARAGDAQFQVMRGDQFEPIFIKGINLGTALPGKFPAEFPDDPKLYREWFDLIGEAGFNALRLYTLHPPSLYEALHRHNLERPTQKLWLIQGVWTELPPEDDFAAASFEGAFRDEIRRVIDALHGNLELPARPGHANGIYRKDVSSDVLSLAIRREWEPFSVDAYNQKYPNQKSFQGRYVQTEGRYPIEAWLASICETAIEHSTEYYGVQYPVGFTSWPTLDPIEHPTEATVEEEMVFRDAKGEQLYEEIKEYDNDLVQLDTMRLHETDAFKAGLFAVYHAYPYYPEFMVLDPDYAKVRDDQGVSRYLGYLQALKKHHGDQPVLIGEFGVPTSRGIAHLHPEGQHHGGHSSQQQGEINARLMRNVADAGLAGGAIFAWIDEWFKRNWIVMNYESPTERNRLWLNALDAEQNYGLMGAYPGADRWKVVLDGEHDDWATVAPTYRGDGELRSLRVTSDEAYLYLAIERASSASRLMLGLDSYDAKRGSHRFPSPVDVESAIGMEFLLELGDRESGRLLVDRPYDLFSNRLRRPYQSRSNRLGDFVEIVTYTNRDRYARDGTYYEAKGYSRSKLRYGSLDPKSSEFNDLADWFMSEDGRRIEVRLPWGLLNVADPSSLRIIHETDSREGVVQTAATDGFRFHLLALDERGRVRARLPQKDLIENYPTFRWSGWEQPTYRLELKPSYFIMQKALAELPAQN
jgi:tetratricopeptide (TPR) repeat protein